MSSNIRSGGAHGFIASLSLGGSLGATRSGMAGVRTGYKYIFPKEDDDLGAVVRLQTEAQLAGNVYRASRSAFELSLRAEAGAHNRWAGGPAELLGVVRVGLLSAGAGVGVHCEPSDSLELGWELMIESMYDDFSPYAAIRFTLGYDDLIAGYFDR